MTNHVLEYIRANPNQLTSQIVAALGSRPDVEDALWDLWESGQIQINPDSTIRETRAGEHVTRDFVM